MENRVTGILLYPGFSEYELSVLLSVLKQGGKQTLFIGIDNLPVKGEAGLPCIPDTSINQVDVTILDSVVLPGVDDFKHLVHHKELTSFLHRIDNQNRVIAAISSAPFFLSLSGVLKGKKYTTGLTVEQRTFLETFDHENYLDLPVVVDDYLITAKGSAFLEFAFSVGDLLKLNYEKSWYYGSHNKRTEQERS